MSTFEPLLDAEHTWLAEQLDASFQFVGSNDTGNSFSPSLELLDDAFADFLNREHDVEDANRVLNLVGVAFGAHLVNRLGFEWGYATDEWGSGLAVLARPGRGDVTIYPVDFVSKRYERREAPFMVNAFVEISKSLADIDSQWRNKP